MDPITIAALIKGGLGLAKTITGGIQTARAKKDLARGFPKYSRPEEYKKMMSIYQQQAGMGQLPGQDRYEAKLSESTARGVRAASKYADSPVAAVAASSQLYSQQQSAIRDLGLQYAAFQQQSQMNLARGLQQGAQYSDQEWYQNKMYPDQVRRNMAAQQFNSGQQNLWGGLDMMGAAGLGFATGGGQAGGQGGGQPGIQTTPGQ
ncbi:MAG: hypothetical protein JXM68_00070, partial [Sedimentisphaerales bacterium]|nr:hypothetical protein [Sedimentisphaerales bacterium]